jgi:hypothetical protein
VYTVRASEAHLLSRKNGIALMLGVAAGIAVLTIRMSPIPQPASYHNFADQRSWLGLTNFLNVISNLAFAIVGVWGIAFILRSGAADQKEPFLDARERWPYLAIFAGLVLPHSARLTTTSRPTMLTLSGIVFQ